MADVVLTHAKVSAKSDTADPTLVQPSDWNDGHALSGGATGALLLRDSTATDGGSWLDAVAAGQFVVSAGAATKPVYSGAGFVLNVATSTITAGVWNAGAVTSSGGISGTTGTFSSTLKGNYLGFYSNQLEEWTTNGLAGIAVNYGGYNNGGTQFRNFILYDGKNAEVATFTGSTKALTLAGTLTVTGHGTTASAANAFLDSGTGLLSRSTSSLRYKDIDHYLTGDEARAMLLALPSPFLYSGKTDKDKRLYLGFGAEEVAPKVPWLATYDGENMTGDPNYVTYDRITTLLVPVVQQHDAHLTTVDARIAALTTENDALRGRVQELETRLKAA